MTLRTADSVRCLLGVLILHTILNKINLADVMVALYISFFDLHFVSFLYAIPLSLTVCSVESGMQDLDVLCMNEATVRYFAF